MFFCVIERFVEASQATKIKVYVIIHFSLAIGRRRSTTMMNESETRTRERIQPGASSALVPEVRVIYGGVVDRRDNAYTRLRRTTGGSHHFDSVNQQLRSSRSSCLCTTRDQKIFHRKRVYSTYFVAPLFSSFSSTSPYLTWQCISIGTILCGETIPENINRFYEKNLEANAQPNAKVFIRFTQSCTSGLFVRYPPSNAYEPQINTKNRH
uniref:Uncharacterized protein n=1 Tax=Trichogramma kaykai TaxID=54128 RepID=A0ABD2VW24_9HYME